MELNDAFEESEEEESDLDLSEYKVPSLAEAELVLRNREELQEIIVPIDHKKKWIIKLYIRELPIEEQLRLLENFMTFDKKGEMSFRWRQYYASVYTMMVKRTEPPIPWKIARFYNKQFLAILMKYLPNPMDFGSIEVISEHDRKNL